MRFDHTRCLECKSPTREGCAQHELWSDVVGPDGSIFGTDYWLCSTRCLRRVLDREVPKRLIWEKDGSDDPDLPDKYIETFLDEFWLDRKLAYRTAAANFATRFAAEIGLHADQLREKRAEEEEKEQARIDREIERETARLEGAWERAYHHAHAEN